MTTFLLWYHQVLSAYYLKKARKAPCGDWSAWEYYMTMSASHAAAMMKILKKEIKAMTALKIKPDLACKTCHGTGEVEEHHPYGMTTATETLFCDCVLMQIPEDQEDREIEIDLSDDRQEKRASEAFTDWNAGERPAHWI